MCKTASPLTEVSSSKQEQKRTVVCMGCPALPGTVLRASFALSHLALVYVKHFAGCLAQKVCNSGSCDLNVNFMWRLLLSLPSK